MQEVADLVVIGGGAAGLACAVAAGRLGMKVTVLERTDRCGKKLMVTGGGKGNFTHAESPRMMAGRFDCDVRLIMPLLRGFPYQRITQFFSSLGIEAWTDDEGCVWPKGTDAAGIRDALLREIAEHGGNVRVGCRVAGLEPGWRVRLVDGSIVAARNVCVATGGASYPRTGSTGDGLALCRGLGLATVEWFPALASLRTKDDLSELAGVTQPRVEMTLLVAGDEPRTATGHFIFAHAHVSGSSVLNLCGHAARALAEKRQVVLRINWAPDRSESKLSEEFAAARAGHPKRQLGTFLGSFVARRLATRLCVLAGVPSGRILTDLSRAEQESIIRQLGSTEFAIVGTEPIERATVTGGGVSLDEVDLKTMAARRFSGLYFAGEVLDVWAETGGYNLHFAWATGITVAESVAASLGRVSSI
ncbi:aminoacetone oxidase family FAD-binding enzyme [candidate division WOR-3 bacterium]|uniref:Aminoacetone oxidase family FAD-binding enzyme n=1 Tax=candidate division WOR-3 bacterium TaxID=2052148 RepID=A0A938BQF3_UNCW3|nr:aminoacetone oxidase family FAD-binding enzyme [candidate division WOR-3 bacterium]